jgi:nucleoid-associated protein YgaU
VSRQSTLKVIFISLIVSAFSTSCGLIEKWKTPEQPTDSKVSSDSSKASGTDDLFTNTMSDTKADTATSGTDAPTIIDTAPKESAATKDDLKSLEDEFSGSTSATTAKEVKQVKVEESLPVIKEDIAPAITENMNADAGKVMTYKVQKGETLMQIAFKIYGDISKWKDLKKMNGTKLSKNSALRSQMELKYNAPEKNFVWNPEGTPYMIKTGETLGTISNSVYQTPKKWKKIWENNKPLIKNPNVIYAGFTLYYKGSGMANYVQPKAVQKKVAAKSVEEKEISSNENNAIEEVKVDRAISNAEAAQPNEIDLTKDIQSVPIRDMNEEVKADEKVDEAIVK